MSVGMLWTCRFGIVQVYESKIPEHWRSWNKVGKSAKLKNVVEAQD